MANEAAEYIRELWDSLVHYKSNKKKKDSATQEIENYIDDYAQNKLPQKTELPQSPVYERMEADLPDDKALQAQAEQELSAYKAQGEKGVEKEIEALGEKYRSDIEAAGARTESARADTAGDYDTAKRNTDADMLKRGLARSSIAANKKAALEQNEAAAYAKISAAYNREVGELEKKIGALSAQRESALNDFNLTYAAKLTERINELKSSREQKAAEALKYNNTLTEKEYAAAVDKTMKESDLYSEALGQREKENKLSAVSEADYVKIYSAVAEKLRGINKNDARDIVLNNPNLRDSVGSAYYYKLYDEFCR